MGYDENKTMAEQIETYSIRSRCGSGTYDVADLKPEHKTYMRCMADMVDAVRDCEYWPEEDGVLGQLKREIAEEVIDEIVTVLISRINDTLYSIMDNDEDYWEKDEEE